MKNFLHKKHFIFYTDYIKTLSLLSVWQQRKLLEALCSYVETGETPLLKKQKTMTVFLKLKTFIDVDTEYENYINERKKAGQKGAQRRWKRHYGTHEIP